MSSNKKLTKEQECFNKKADLFSLYNHGGERLGQTSKGFMLYDSIMNYEPCGNEDLNEIKHKTDINNNYSKYIVDIMNNHLDNKKINEKKFYLALTACNSNYWTRGDVLEKALFSKDEQELRNVLTTDFRFK